MPQFQPKQRVWHKGTLKPWIVLCHDGGQVWAKPEPFTEGNREVFWDDFLTDVDPHEARKGESMPAAG